MLILELTTRYKMSVEVRIIDNTKGKGLFATTFIPKGTIIFEEDPLVCCQFSWNAACKYPACDHCLRPLESAEENVRRLTKNYSLSLPHPDQCKTAKEQITSCNLCGVKYCSQSCQDEASNQYHKVLCLKTWERNNTHPFEQLEEAWKQMHYPPETSSIFLIVRLLARIIQAPNTEEAISQTLNFCHKSSNSEEALAHKFLGEQFVSQISLLREMVSNALPHESIQQFLTPEGFQSLIALIGTNGQGVATSPFSAWQENIFEKVNLSPEENQQIDAFVRKIYDEISAETGDFLDNEGVALYLLQSCANHSCTPNAEIKFLHNSSRLSLVALNDIQAGEEICISYIDECNLTRSRHSRRKILMENYLFGCDCPKCILQIEDPDETSEEEMSDCSSDD